MGLALILLLWISVDSNSPERYTCGESKKVVRSYGKVEVRVDCDLAPGRMLVTEYKGDTPHGFSQGFDIATGRRTDSSFYLNGEENGQSKCWDSLGNVLCKAYYRKGKPIGLYESYFSAGKPRLIKNYDTNGKEDGAWKEWWKNGNKKAEFLAKNGVIVSGTEYYQNGKTRTQYVTKFEPARKSVLKTKYIRAEAWAPNGKSTGKIVNGNGEWILFPDGRDSTALSVFHEYYVDSVLVKGERLDTVEIKKWLR